MPSTDRGNPALDADLLVIGAGMAGLTAASSAARGGLRVIVIERAAEVGGSAALSGGYLWTAPSADVLAEQNPNGDRALGAALVEGYPDLLEWVASTGVAVGDRVPVLYGRGQRVDILQYLRRCVGIVTGSGGWVLTGRETMRLLATKPSTSRITGAMAKDRDGMAEISARFTVLATGGFQGSRELLDRHLGHEKGRRLLLRSNPHSRGTGLKLAEEAGAAISGDMQAFYGHLVAGPVPSFGPTEYSRLATLFSDQAILADRAGRRFVDESLGDHFSVQACAGLEDGRCLLVMDDSLAHETKSKPLVAGAEVIDPFEEARRAGAPTAIATSLDEISTQAKQLGFHGERLVETVRDFNNAIVAGRDPMHAPRRGNHRTHDVGPWRLMELRPAITFTHGGIRIDPCARVLDQNGQPIPGLLAAGADTGGVFDGGYAGGLSLAGVFGRKAARAAGGAVQQ